MGDHLLTNSYRTAWKDKHPKNIELCNFQLAKHNVDWSTPAIQGHSVSFQTGVINNCQCIPIDFIQKNLTEILHSSKNRKPK